MENLETTENTEDTETSEKPSEENNNTPYHSQVLKLLSLPPGPPQKSEEWLENRKDKLTSSDISAPLGKNIYKSYYQLLVDKCKGSTFTGNIHTRWGEKYEDEAIEVFSKEYDKKVELFNLIEHPTIPWLGGSPDGITRDGILLEVKCPHKRKIVPGKIPDYYLPQVLMNMEICELDKAAFIEYRPPELTHGEYEMNVVWVDRNKDWFDENYPILENFWKDVLYYRKYGIETHPKWQKNKKRSDEKKKQQEQAKSFFVNTEKKIGCIIEGNE